MENCSEIHKFSLQHFFLSFYYMCFKIAMLMADGAVASLAGYT